MGLLIIGWCADDQRLNVLYEGLVGVCDQGGRSQGENVVNDTSRLRVKKRGLKIILRLKCSKPKKIQYGNIRVFVSNL